MFMSVDPLAEKFPNYNPYIYTLNNPINLVDPDGRQPRNPKRSILHSSSSGNMRGVSVSKDFRFIPPSYQSFSGESRNISSLKENSKLNSKVINLLINAPYIEMNLSVSEVSKKQVGQYYNANGGKVDNIGDANSLIITEYNKVTTSNLGNGSVDVNESYNSSIYGISESNGNYNLELKDLNNTNANKVKSSGGSLLNFFENTLKEENAKSINNWSETVKSEHFNSNAERDYNSAVRESGMDSRAQQHGERK